MSDPQDFVIPGVRQFQWDAMREYVRNCADTMRLRDWTIYFVRQCPDGLHEANAAIEITEKRFHFCIWLPPQWFERCNGSEEDRQEARSSVAHELLHVKFVHMDRLVENIETNLGDAGYGIFLSIYKLNMEQFIDDLSEVVASALPLPEIPTKVPPRSKARHRGGVLRPETV